jgi:hypothetical protein
MQHFVHGLGTEFTEYLDMTSRGDFVHCMAKEGRLILDRIISVTPLEDLQIEAPLISKDEAIITYPDTSNISALPAREELLQLTTLGIGLKDEIEDPTPFPLSIEEEYFNDDSSKAPTCNIKDLKFRLARQDLVIPGFYAKTKYSLYHDPGSIVPHIRPKVFTDNQMSRIKYNYYYINSVSKDFDDSQRNGTVKTP